MPQMPSEEHLRGLQGEKMQVSELLAMFGTRVRSKQSVLIISQELKAAGLSTLPYFATCNQRTDVQFVTLESVPSAAPEEETEEDGLAQGALPQRPFKIGDLPAANGGIDSVASGAQLTEAVHLMRAKNYSQMPVMDDPSTVSGVVTWRSLAMMYATGVPAVLENAMVDDPPVAEAHLDFFAMLPIVSEYGYLLVRGANGRFSGIVTAADITERFEATAWPFFVVGEIESRLRKCLGARLEADAVRAVQRREKTGRVTDLAFGDYVFLLDGEPRIKDRKKREDLRARADQNWQRLGWTGVNREQFVRHLDRVRDIRNKIAHFDSEPLSQQLCDELRQFVAQLRDIP